MPYKARFSKIFLKKEEKLPSNNKPRIVGPLKGLWRVRIGKYRIIYEINEKEKIVVFHDIDLRKRVY